MTVFARRYHWQKVHPFENTLLLDAFVAHPEFLNYPHSQEEARAIGAHLLTDPSHFIWASYNDKDLTGVILLTRIVPRVDALLHFFFIDQNLAAKRKLLQNIIGYCFTDLGLNRLSMEVPEGVRLERFARKVLNFRLEGETRQRNPELPKSLSDNWVARQGSRREQGYFDGTTWSDILLLRLLASEWVADGKGRPDECQSEQLQEPQPPSSAGPSEAPSEGEAPRTPSPSSPKTSNP